MCGISGIYDYSNQLNKDLLIENINSMCKLFKHRGPDNCSLQMFVHCH